MSEVSIRISVWHLALLMLVAGAAIGGAVAFALVGGSEKPKGQVTAAEPTDTAVPTVTQSAAATSTPNKTATDCDERTAAEKVRRSVVRIQTVEAVGTGFIVSTDGLVVTNEHVVDVYRNVVLTLFGGSVVNGTVLAKDASRDLALIRINNTPGGLAPISWGSEASLRPASRLLAWGYAEDIPGEPSLTTGVFSGLRKIGAVPIVQTDTPINHGNSGGPLFTDCGEVIGVVSFSLRDTQGLNFAIAGSEARSYSGQASSTSATSRAAPTPEETVILFYSLLDQKAYEAAYGLLSSAFKARGTLEGFRAGYATTTGVYVESARTSAGSASTVNVSILATDLVQGRTIVQRFTGSWTVVQEGGSWKLDSARIQVTP